MVNFNNGKIYAVYSPSSDKCYIGSTVQPLKQRLYKHQSRYRCQKDNPSRYVSSMEIVKHGDSKIILLENFPCDNGKQLEIREWLISLQYPNRVNMVKPSAIGTLARPRVGVNQRLGKLF